MEQRLSYADAVKLLREPDSRIADALDKITGGALLGAVIAVPDALNWLDARAEFAQLSGELVSRLPDRLKGLSRFSRTQRIEAAHAVVVIAAYFEAFSQIELPVELRALMPTKAEQVAIAAGASSASSRLKDLTATILQEKLPAQIPLETQQRMQETLE